MTIIEIILLTLITISFLLGAWPLAIILLCISIYQMKKPKEKTTEDAIKKETDYNRNKTEIENSPNEKQKISEFEIYRQAADIEKHLKEDKP